MTTTVERLLVEEYKLVVRIGELRGDSAGKARVAMCACVIPPDAEVVEMLYSNGTFKSVRLVEATREQMRLQSTRLYERVDTRAELALLKAQKEAAEARALAAEERYRQARVADAFKQGNAEALQCLFQCHCWGTPCHYAT